MLTLALTYVNVVHMTKQSNEAGEYEEYVAWLAFTEAPISRIEPIASTIVED